MNKAEKAEKRKVNDEKDIFSSGSDGDRSGRFDGARRSEVFDRVSGAGGLCGSATRVCAAGSGVCRTGTCLRACTGVCRSAGRVCAEAGGEIWFRLRP